MSGWLAAAPSFAPPAMADTRLTDYESAIIRAVKTAGPSVVSVRTVESSQDYWGDVTQRPGLGSGVIISADGYILTNNHVISGADNITVGLSNGRELPARSLGGDPRLDLAVIKVDATGLPAAVTGDSDNLEVGQLAIAIGNPLGFERSVTTGIISAKKRALRGTVSQLRNLIQVDATINPGNSGGPLVDSSGRVIGINTALVTGGAQGGGGLGFAIPINTARVILKQLQQYGRVIRPPWLGIPGFSELHEEALQLGYPSGLVVPGVYRDSPAHRAGIRRGDIITRVDGRKVDTEELFNQILLAKNAGDKMDLEITRPATGERLKMTVTLVETPQ
ncbi:MAG TPA: trypsin-like peptidase domain-containing protein [Armatimonadota bacterium]